jgi:hypothetical protein
MVPTNSPGFGTIFLSFLTLLSFASSLRRSYNFPQGKQYGHNILFRHTLRTATTATSSLPELLEFAGV